MPTPSLAEDGGSSDDEEPETESMPEDTPDDPEEEVEEIEEELDREEEDSPEDEQTDGGDEEEEVAEAQMPEDDEDAEETDGDSQGILARINTKAIIVASAIAIGAVLVLWFLRSASNSTASSQPATEEDLEGDAYGEEEYDIDAPENQPLKQDEQMMGALGMGE